MENKLPKNWVETDLFTISNVSTGKKDANHAKDDGEYVFYTCALEQTKSPTYSFEGSSIIVPGNGNIGYVFYYDGKFEAYQRTYVINDIRIDPKYLFYHFKCFWKSRTVDNLYGSTIQYVKIGNFKSYKVEIPPQAEQNRIVDKLDRLFAQLETIKTSMAKVPLLLKDFRQQVLTLAVNGKLTKEWRNGKNMKVWEELTLSELIVEKPRNGYSPRAVDYETTVKSLSLSATTSGSFDSSYVKYLDIESPSKDSHLWLKNGDILLQRSNSLEYVGTSAIYDSEDFEFIYPDIMIKIRANERIVTNYLNYCLSSFKTREYFRNNATGTAGNMPKINQVVVMNTPINLPSHQEQQEIIHRVESLFAKADAIEQQYKSLKAKIDTLPQSILHKAFKGELSEQLETDGDARELVEEIRSLKELEVKFKPKSKPKSSINKRKVITKTDILKPHVGKNNSQNTLMSYRNEQIRKSKTFILVQNNFNTQSFHFTEIIEKSKLDYEQIKIELQEILELTKLGMRPGLIEQYINKKEGIKLKWIDK
jgi:type I restriction enzyme S subunit